jgi:Co/Zn/Cd efflux system component
LDSSPEKNQGTNVSICGVKVTNTTLLIITATCFSLFVLAEIIGAIASGSLSLLGDASAMSVDVFTVRRIYQFLQSE